MGIHINCKEATLLVEKRQQENIGLINALKLNFHLFICKACHSYKKQSLIISKMLQKGIDSNPITTQEEEALKVKIKSKIVV